jgi:DNA helicase-2/ATP-dependent DNA helicase PcrA
VIIQRICYLIQKGVPPHRILAVTFTRKAAGEMKTRVVKYLGNIPENSEGERHFSYSNHNPHLPWIGTFHSLALAILKKNQALGKFKIIGRDESRAFRWQIAREFLCDAGTLPLGQWIFEERDTPQQSGPALQRKFFDKLERQKKLHGYLEYHDFVKKVLHFWQNDSQQLKNFQNSYDAILVDEFQDTNPEQLEFVRQFLLMGHDFLAVGDDYQGIYGFRGSSIQSFIRFERFFPGSKYYKLKNNYRSTKNIVHLCNKILKLNRQKIDKKMVSQSVMGVRPGFIFFQNRNVLVDFFRNGFPSRLDPDGRIPMLGAMNKGLAKSAVILVRLNYLKDKIQSALGTESPWQVLTIHQSKGLEFDIVLVAGIEEGIFPHRDSDIEEERRLLFVAASRARENLYFAIIPGDGGMEHGFWRELGIGYLRAGLGKELNRFHAKYL